MRLRTDVCLAAMVSAGALLHAHAWRESRPDDCGVSSSVEEAVAAGRRPRCGDPYAEEFPLYLIAATAVIVGVAVHLSIRASEGRTAWQTVRRAAAIGLLAFQAVAPMTYTMGDWEGTLGALVLWLLAFPLGPHLTAAGGWLLARAGRAPEWAGDPVYGRFSTALACENLALASVAYLQWFVLAPWLIRRARRAMHRCGP